MAYIETLAPRDWGFCTLFGYPYAEGIRNIRVGLPCCDSIDPTKSPSLLGRVAHVILGLALLIPVINTLIFIALRLFSPEPPIFREKITTVPVGTQTEAPSSEPSAEPSEKNELELKLTALTTKRDKLLVKAKEFDEETKKNQRIEAFKKVQEVEFEAAEIMRKGGTQEVMRHIRSSSSKDESITNHDGVISSLPKEAKPIKIRMEGTPKSNFTQVGGLSQVEAYNHLCGYYALFFMLQAVTEKEFTDRDAFAPILKKWIKMIAIKRVTSYLTNNRDKPFPYRTTTSVKGLVYDEMQYLIDNCEELEVLRKTKGCFLLSMEEYNNPTWIKGINCAEPIKLLGKSKTDDETPSQFPLYFILKEGMHYYFVYTKEQPSPKKTAEFTFVHSLNYSVLNPSCFSAQTFLDIISAIGGERTPLRIKW